MSQRTDDLFLEILENVRYDRKKVAAIRDRIVDIATSDNPAMTIEPLAMLGAAENIAKLSDVLTKMNSQLVELTKVSSKSDNPDSEEQDNKDDIFDAIESPLTSSVEGQN